MIPKREEAYAVAQENISIDAARHERTIESLLMVWDGVTEIRLDIPGSDMRIVSHLVRQLKEAGFTVRSTERANAAKDWVIYFK